MYYCTPGAARRSRSLFILLLSHLAVAAGVGLARPAAADTRVLIGFKRPAFVLSAPVRKAILSRTREQAQIAALHGQISRHLWRADAVAATLSTEAIVRLRGEPSVAYIEPDRPIHLLQLAVPGDAVPNPTELTPELLPWGVGGDDQAAGVRAAGSGADGEGVRVGVLDTGIGPHPDLDVKGGYNFVANTADYTDDHGHGTHVAGTIAALHNDIGVVGVAPKAELYAIKVLDARGEGSTSDSVAGIEWAIEHHMQVLNMSYGALDADETEHRVIEAAVAAGIVVVAAAGNDGGAVAYPAAYPEVISVGAVDASGQVASFSSHGPELSFVAPGVGILSTVPGVFGYSLDATRSSDGVNEVASSGMRFSAATPADGITGPVRFAGRGTSDDLAGVDLKGAIALMERGDITLAEKVANAAAAGAIGALIYNNVPGSYRGTLGSAGAIPALALPREEGLALKANPDSTVRLYVTPYSLYTRFSGTSMACPHVTGVVALLLSVRPDLDPAGVRKILKETATDLGAPGRDDLYGDGLVNATAAVQAARGQATPSSNPPAAPPMAPAGNGQPPAPSGNGPGAPPSGTETPAPPIGGG